MTTKHKLIITAIILAVIIALIAAVKLLPFWVTLVSLGTFIWGTATGWYAKYIKDKYLKKGNVTTI